MDYQGNPKKSKLEIEIEVKPEKNIERVTSGEVIVAKKTLGRKIKDIFIEADFKGVLRYIGRDILIPAAKNMIVDSTQRGVERVIYGETASRRRQYGGYGSGSRYQYNNPINRPYRDAVHRDVTNIVNPGNLGNPVRSTRRPQDAYILSSREEAELVLDQMNEILDNYDVASVADLHSLLGLGTNPIENKWGWTFLGNVQIRQIREGYLLDLPLPEPID